MFQGHPHRHAHRSRQMRDARITGDYQVQVLHRQRYPLQGHPLWLQAGERGQRKISGGIDAMLEIDEFYAGDLRKREQVHRVE